MSSTKETNLQATTGSSRSAKTGGVQTGAPVDFPYWQIVSVAVCAALAVLMILNTQMSGEGMWFWYGTALRGGAKLYSQLHTALQPLFVLEMSTWLRLFGSKLFAFEIPSLIHALLLALAIYLVLRESPWPDWQKALVLLGTFVLIVGGHSYRLDDYHVVAEFLILYALWVLLLIGRTSETDAPGRDIKLVGLLGVLCGLTWTTRVTDGAALITASVLSLPVVMTRRRFSGLGLLLLMVVLTVVVTVLLTGDTLGAYAANSIFRAAASKGGTGSIFLAPLAVIGNTFPMLATQKKVPFFLVSLFLLSYLLYRFESKLSRFIVPLELVFAGAVLLLSSPVNRIDLKRGLLYEDLVLFLTLAMYLVAAWILFRFLRHLQGRGSWDRREVLILLPILEWASYSAGAAAEPLTNYYEPVAILLLLLPVLQPLRKQAGWFNQTVVTIMTLIAVNGIVSKVLIPYSWQNYKYSPMFTNRQWYQHPVYGPMYVDRDLLRFSEKVCRDIGAVPGSTHPDLLSLPYPYPNYFCATKPWHDYVQTFFDTATRGAMKTLMQELETAPPQWIVYQRQINIMNGSERLYNHNEAIPQRSLDAMIAQKLASHQWTLVDYSNYLQPTDPESWNDTGWYVIRTGR